MPGRIFPHRQERLRVYRLLLGLAGTVSEVIYGHRELGSSLDGLFVAIAVALGHAENKPMGVSKLAHYLGMSRQTVSRRLDELIKLGVVERKGSVYYISPRRYERIEHLMQANKLIIQACRDVPGNSEQSASAVERTEAAPSVVPKMDTDVF
jgi:predicted transcriptional regulator